MKRAVSSQQSSVIRGPVGYALLTAACLLFIFGCNKNPFDRTTNGSGGGPTGSFTPANSFVIFNNELTTGGGAFEYPGSENQSLTFSDMSNPVSHRSIRYSWTGGLVTAPGCTPNPTPLFAGFDLMHVVDNTLTLSIYSSTPGRDLHQAGYTKATFYARGSLSSHTVLKIEVAAPGSPPGCSPPPTVPCLWLHDSNSIDIDDGVNAQGCGHMVLTGNWGSYSILFPGGWLNTTLVKDFFKATFVFNQPGGVPTGQGGTAYFDVILYQP